MKSRIFIGVLLQAILFFLVGCNTGPSSMSPIDSVSDGSSTNSTSETSTVTPLPSPPMHSVSTTSPIQSTDGVSPTQLTTTTNSEGDKTEDSCKLIVRGKDITTNSYVKLNYEYSYAELPLTAIMKELGADVTWQDPSSVIITFDGIDYYLDTTKGTLIKDGGSVNILSVAPGSNHGVFYEMADGELIIDSDSATGLIVHIMGEKINIDYDNRVINIG